MARITKAFVHERHHMLVKKYSFHRKNAASMELGIIEDITVVQLQMFEPMWHQTGSAEYVSPLRATLKALKDMHPDEPAEGLMVTRSFKSSCGNTMSVGDTVMFFEGGDRRFGELVVLYRLSRSGRECAVIFQWDLHRSQPYSDAVRLCAREYPVIVEASKLEVSLIFSSAASNTVSVALLPVQYR